MPLFKSHLNAIKLSHNKNTQDKEFLKMPLPKILKIPMSMNIGAPCVPCVKAGDKVSKGQVIGEATEFLCVPIHSPAFATVKSIDDFTTSNGIMTKIVVLEVDEEQPNVEFTPPNVESQGDLVKAALDCGLVGLGGAAFPTFVKLNPKNLDEVDTLIINAAECEPYITSDYRAMLDKTENILYAIDKIVEFLKLEKVIVGIEDNKPKAIEKFTEIANEINYLTVKKLRSRYPQGAEKVLVFETTGKVIEEGKLPSDVGVIVMNVSTVEKLGEYLITGIPLIERNLTIDGTALNNSMNITAPIGTSISDLVEFSGGYSQEPQKILYGGPMMGVAVKNDSMPIMKSTNAIVVFADGHSKRDKITPCIRCGRCHRACPFGLLPVAFERGYYANDHEGLMKLHVLSCMECGCCAYVCPANRDLVATNRLAKRIAKSKQVKG